MVVGVVWLFVGVVGLGVDVVGDVVLVGDFGLLWNLFFLYKFVLFVFVGFVVLFVVIFVVIDDVCVGVGEKG